MTIIKPFNFYGYYVTVSRFKNTNKVTFDIHKWEYHFKVYKKSKNVLTLNRTANNLSRAKKELRYIMTYEILLEKKGKSYYTINVNKEETKFRKLLDEHDEENIDIEVKDIPLSVVRKNKSYLMKRYKSGFITLYRGIGWHGKQRYNLFKKTSNWTTSKQIAYNFSEHRSNLGKIIAIKINIQDVLISHYTMSALRYEKEVIIKAHPKIYNSKEYNPEEFKNKFKLKERWS